MNIQRARNPDAAPKTRRELLSHLWACPDLHDVNVFKEGPLYAARKGRVIAATHRRSIDSLSFAGWENFIRNIPENIHGPA